MFAQVVEESRCSFLVPIAFPAIASLPTIIPTATTPCAKRQSVPDSNEQDSSNQGADNRYTVEYGITTDIQWNKVREYPDARQRGKNGSNKTQGEPPTNDKFRDEADNSGDYEISDFGGGHIDCGGTKDEGKHTVFFLYTIRTR